MHLNFKITHTHTHTHTHEHKGFPGGSEVKYSPVMWEMWVQPWFRMILGEGKGNPFQYSFVLLDLFFY